MQLNLALSVNMPAIDSFNPCQPAFYGDEDLKGQLQNSSRKFLRAALKQNPKKQYLESKGTKHCTSQKLRSAMKPVVALK
jgi:hypothetical protein